MASDKTDLEKLRELKRAAEEAQAAVKQHEASMETTIGDLVVRLRDDGMFTINKCDHNAQGFPRLPSGGSQFLTMNVAEAQGYAAYVIECVGDGRETTRKAKA